MKLGSKKGVIKMKRVLQLVAFVSSFKNENIIDVPPDVILDRAVEVIEGLDKNPVVKTYKEKWYGHRKNS